MRRTTHRSDSTHAAIVSALRLAGCTVWPLAGASGERRGAPDLLVARNGSLFLLEAKAAKGRLSADQVEWHAWWRSPVAVVRSADEALAAVGAR